MGLSSPATDIPFHVPAGCFQFTRRSGSGDQPEAEKGICAQPDPHAQIIRGLRLNAGLALAPFLSAHLNNEGGVPDKFPRKALEPVLVVKYVWSSCCRAGGRASTSFKMVATLWPRDVGVPSGLSNPARTRNCLTSLVARAFPSSASRMSGSMGKRDEREIHQLGALGGRSIQRRVKALRDRRLRQIPERGDLPLVLQPWRNPDMEQPFGAVELHRQGQQRRHSLSASGDIGEKPMPVAISPKMGAGNLHKLDGGLGGVDSLWEPTEIGTIQLMRQCCGRCLESSSRLFFTSGSSV